MSFSAMVDASNAIGRLYDVFVAELLTEQQVTNHDLDVAVRVKDASFTWDAPPVEENVVKNGKKSKKDAKEPKDRAASKTNNKGGEIFQIKNLSFDIPRGSLVAFVGPVGSGKSSLLQGLIGEMRKIGGQVTFGGSVGYCSQSAWIQVRFTCCKHTTNWMYQTAYDFHRMQLYGRISVSDVLSMKQDIGKR